MYAKRVAEAIELAKARAGAMMAPVKAPAAKSDAAPAPRELAAADAGAEGTRASFPQPHFE